MSKVIVYDRHLKHPLVVNEDGSINVKGVELGGEGIDIDIGEIEVEVPDRRLVMKKSFKEKTSKKFTLETPHHFLAVSNDSKDKRITLKIHDMTIEILPWESFEAEFDEFSSFELINKENADVRIAVFKKRVVDQDD